FGIQMLVPLGKEKYVVMSEVAGGVVDIVLNAMLIPEFGCAGAAIGTLVAEFTVSLVQYIALGEYRKGIFGGIHIIPVMVSVITAGVAAYVIKLFNIDLKAELVLSGIVFFTLYAVIMYSLVIKKEGLF
ncbi:MAG: polysaccharide biosynthesis C-terminal domain-containing protein, partial [Lachnospiraceae bacterium]|nr:polysaccharide biosynthesis C-terminal domain-containing protein [Lachnospiraceae bacterium]